MRDRTLSLKTTNLPVGSFPSPPGLLSLVSLLLLLVVESAPVRADAGDMKVELTTYTVSPDTTSTNNAQTDGAQADGISTDNTCPTGQGFRAEVTSLLGRDPFSKDSPAMRIEVKIQGSGNRYSGTLGVKDSDSSRSFEARNCPDLTSTIALAIVIAIDPFFIRPPEAPLTEPDTEQSDSEQPDSPPENSVTLPALSPEEPVPSDDEAEPDDDEAVSPLPTHSGLRLSASLQPLVSLGLTPAVSGGLAVGVGLHQRNSSIQLSALVTTRGQEDFSMGALDAQVFYLSVVPCWDPATYSVCASMSIGALRARGLAPLTERANILRVHSALGMRGYVSLLENKALRIRWFIDGQARLSRTTLTVGSDQAWSTPALFVQTGLEFSLD